MSPLDLVGVKVGGTLGTSARLHLCHCLAYQSTVMLFLLSCSSRSNLQYVDQTAKPKANGIRFRLYNKYTVFNCFYSSVRSNALRSLSDYKQRWCKHAMNS